MNESCRVGQRSATPPPRPKRCRSEVGCAAPTHPTITDRGKLNPRALRSGSTRRPQPASPQTSRPTAPAIASSSCSATARRSSQSDPAWTRPTTDGRPVRRALAVSSTPGRGPGNGGSSRTAAEGIASSGALPPPSVGGRVGGDGGDAVLRRGAGPPAARPATGGRRPASPGTTRGESGEPPRPASSARRRVASRAARVILSTRRARAIGSASIRSISGTTADQQAALGAAQQLVARDQHEVGAGGQALGDGRLARDDRRPAGGEGAGAEVVDRRQAAGMGEGGERADRRPIR